MQLLFLVCKLPLIVVWSPVVGEFWYCIFLWLIGIRVSSIWIVKTYFLFCLHFNCGKLWVDSLCALMNHGGLNLLSQSHQLVVRDLYLQLQLSNRPQKLSPLACVIFDQLFAHLFFARFGGLKLNFNSSISQNMYMSSAFAFSRRSCTNMFSVEI